MVFLSLSTRQAFLCPPLGVAILLMIAVVLLIAGVVALIVLPNPYRGE